MNDAEAEAPQESATAKAAERGRILGLAQAIQDRLHQDHRYMAEVRTTVRDRFAKLHKDACSEARRRELAMPKPASVIEIARVVGRHVTLEALGMAAGTFGVLAEFRAEPAAAEPEPASARNPRRDLFPSPGFGSPCVAADRFSDRRSATGSDSRSRLMGRSHYAPWSRRPRLARPLSAPPDGRDLRIAAAVIAAVLLVTVVAAAVWGAP